MPKKYQRINQNLEINKESLLEMIELSRLYSQTIILKMTFFNFGVSIVTFIGLS